MIVWRITKRKYATRRELLRGEGAKEYGGRWNLPGLPAVYASATSSLAMLETLVHVSPATLPASLVAVQIIIPKDASFNEIAPTDVHRGWQRINDDDCAQRGSEWLRSNIALALFVPSAVNPLERNIILNPGHDDIARCEIGEITPVNFDNRLLSFLMQ